MAKRLSADDKKNIVKAFIDGDTVDQLSKKFNCTILTIKRNLKQNIGENLYKQLLKKNKPLNQIRANKLNSTKKIFQEEMNKETSNKRLIDVTTFNEKISEKELSSSETFLEITPLNCDIENAPRKEFSSIPISQIDFPKLVYMVVDKNIELEIKFLKEYPEWNFLPTSDLNRKTIAIYYDIKVAKSFCNKDQKVIKVPNTDVFRIAAPILISRGISRIVSSEQLISL